MILLIGAQGNMGRRYASILNHLEIPYKGVDIETPVYMLGPMARQADGIIIATPTFTHAEVFYQCVGAGRPILCEKPVVKDMGQLKHMLGAAGRCHTPFRMIYQYSEICDRHRAGDTHYDYYKHGTDGLHWDCIQIVGLSKGAVELRETSPIWDCVINGERLDVSDMDGAYIDYIKRWRVTPGQSHQEILDVHMKTDELARAALNGRI